MCLPFQCGNPPIAEERQSFDSCRPTTTETKQSYDLLSVDELVIDGYTPIKNHNLNITCENYNVKLVFFKS